VRPGSRQAEALIQRAGLTYDQLLGLRFAVNVAIASAIVWYTLRLAGENHPIWAIASMVAASDPEPAEARRIFKSRLINVVVGCITGICFLFVIGSKPWVLPFALFVTVLLSTYVVRVKTMWRQAPITAAIVIASSLVGHSEAAGLAEGLHKVGQVLFGCVVGLVVSWVMSKLWLIRPPVNAAHGSTA
jgi:uncharacterized membrane protein YccC